MNKKNLKNLIYSFIACLLFTSTLDAKVSFGVRVGDGNRHGPYYYNDRYCSGYDNFGYCSTPLQSNFRGHVFYNDGHYYYYSHNYYDRYHRSYYDYGYPYYYDRRPHYRRGFGIYFGVPGFQIHYQKKDKKKHRRHHRHHRR